MCIKNAQYYSTEQMKLHKKESLSPRRVWARDMEALLQELWRQKTHIADNKRRFGVEEPEIEQRACFLTRTLGWTQHMIN